MNALRFNTFRSLAAVVALTLATASFAIAEGTTVPVHETQHRKMLWGLERDDPAIAVGAIVGGIALLVLFTWVGVRLSDER